MSSWEGSDGKYDVNGMPHKTKIIRKPKGVGAEVKSIACSKTGILVRLDIMEGKKRQAEKPWHTEFGEGTALVLRLCEQFFGSGRVVHADSAFSSFKTTVELLKRGLYFMGIVKTAHTQYPKAHLLEWVAGSLEGQEGLPPRGAYYVLEHYSEEARRSIYALAWNDKKAKTIISSCGTTNPGNPSVRPRHKIAKDPESGEVKTITYTKSVQRPQMIELFFKYFSTIDVHDHFRQGSLGMERSWHTHSWWHRLFSTLFGMTVVDAFLGYRYESLEAHGSPMELTEFIGKLAHQLIFNDFLQDDPNLRHREGVPDDEEVKFALTLTLNTHLGMLELIYFFFGVFLCLGTCFSPPAENYGPSSIPRRQILCTVAMQRVPREVLLLLRQM